MCFPFEWTGMTIGNEDWREAMECIVELINHTNGNETLALMIRPDCCPPGSRVCLLRTEKGAFTAQYVIDRLHAYFGVVRTGRSYVQGIVALVPADDRPFSPNSLVERIEGFSTKGAVILVKESELGVVGDVALPDENEDEEEDDY